MHNVNNRLRLIMFFQLFSSGALTPILSLLFEPYPEI